MANAKGKSKVISKKEGNFAKGGTTSMLKMQHTGTKVAGVTGKVESGGGGKFAVGGKGHMFGKQTAGPRPAGKTGK